MGTLGVVLLLAGSVIIARTIQRSVSPSTARGPIGYELIVIAVAAAIGGFVASELLGRFGEWGYEFDGLYAFPAAIGAVVVGLVVALVLHLLEIRSQYRV